MKYVDTVQLATLATDGYGDKTVTVLTQSKATFIQRSSVAHTANADGIQSDATMYLDPKNALVVANLDDLEGMYVEAETGWYSVEHVIVARRKLLGNDIDNIYCQLQKQPGVAYVTYVS